MKKGLKYILPVLALVLVLGGSFYTVGEDQYACTVRFSKIIATADQPGLHMKLPFVDSVKYFSKATMLYDIPPSEVLTSDKQNMTVDCYILWRISDPLRFYQTLGTTTVAEQRLDALTYNALKTVMGTLTQSDIINMNAVYSRMISERNQMAEKYSADGNYDASIIRNDVDKQINIAVSNAKAQAAELEAQGEAEYMRLLAEAYDTPEKQEFYRFTLALDALKQSLDGSEKTVILDGDSELAQILTGIG